MPNPIPTNLMIFTGPMFSGKTERLILQLKTFGYAKKRTIVAKPRIDTRTEGFIASRKVLPDGTSEITDRIEAELISSAEEFRALTAGDDFDVLAIDEVQFFPLDTPMQDSLGWFGREIRDLLHRRRDSSLQILIAGLDTDSADRPFGIMPGLLAMADHVEKLAAVCMECHSLGARKSQSLSGEKAGIRIGDADIYQARCRACLVPTT